MRRYLFATVMLSGSFLALLPIGCRGAAKHPPRQDEVAATSRPPSVELLVHSSTMPASTRRGMGISDVATYQLLVGNDIEDVARILDLNIDVDTLHRNLIRYPSCTLTAAAIDGIVRFTISHRIITSVEKIGERAPSTTTRPVGEAQELNFTTSDLLRSLDHADTPKPASK